MAQFRRRDIHAGRDVSARHGGSFNGRGDGVSTKHALISAIFENTGARTPAAGP